MCGWSLYKDTGEGPCVGQAKQPPQIIYYTRDPCNAGHQSVGLELRLGLGTTLVLVLRPPQKLLLHGHHLRDLAAQLERESYTYVAVCAFYKLD